jgi:hypothetical protein
VTRTAAPAAAFLSVPHVPYVPHTLKSLLPGTFQDQIQITAVTHLIEDGYDPLFVQQQVGHCYASTTALYTVSSDFRNRALRAALDRSVQAALGGDAARGTGDR